MFSRGTFVATYAQGHFHPTKICEIWSPPLSLLPHRLRKVATGARRKEDNEMMVMAGARGCEVVKLASVVTVNWSGWL